MYFFRRIKNIFKDFFIVINIFNIVNQHYKSLIKSNALLGVIIFSILSTSSFFYYGIYSFNLETIIVNCLSIFIGFFLTLLLFIPSIISTGKGYFVKERLELLKELFHNLSYVTIISIITLILIVIKNSFSLLDITVKALEIIIFFIITNIMFTLLMIMKRVFSVFSYDINNQ